MFVIARLILTAIVLFMFISLFLDDFEDRHNAISYKIYLFLFIFIINFLFQFFTNLVYSKKIIISEFIEVSINNSLIAVIAFDVYNDLAISNYFAKYNRDQKILVMVLLIVGFMATIKILELLISAN
jgi:hypothetical protein